MTLHFSHIFLTEGLTFMLWFPFPLFAYFDLSHRPAAGVFFHETL